MLALDVSNYTSELSPASLDIWKQAGVQLVICQAVDPPSPFPPTQTRDQIQACLNAGLAVDAYVWLWFALDEQDIQRKLSLLDNLPIRRLWLDVEDAAAKQYDQAACEAKVSAALALCDAYATTSGERCGVYSGRWYWADRNFMGNTTTFSDRDLWDANYDEIADAAVGFVPYGGWTGCAIKQWQGTSTFHGVAGVDLDALSETEAAKITPPTPAPAPTPPADECDWPWVAKKPSVVGAAGELLSIADQLTAEAARPSGPRRATVRALADQVRQRANLILA